MVFQHTHQEGAGGVKRCPACGEPIPERRFGVRLPPIKLRIFDAVRAEGDVGIKARDLIRIVYEGRPRTLETVRNHIRQMNDLLAGTDIEIVTHDRRHWQLAKRKEKRK